LFVVCADVGLHGSEFEMVRVVAHQGLVRPSRGEPRVGERRRREDVEARPVDEERATRRHRFDDLGVGPSHAPLAEAKGEFEDIRHLLEAVLQGVPKGMWSWIQDEGVLEKCMGVLLVWRTVVRREAIASAVMTGTFPRGVEGPIDSGVPPLERGPCGVDLEAP
jgi:hypothetical protein